MLLIGLIEYGKEFLEKINGMFAFVFVDRKNQSILAARDRMGIKPLFFRYVKRDSLNSLVKSEP